MGLFLKKKNLLGWWDFLPLQNWIHKLSLLLKLPQIKLEPWFVLWNLFLLRLLFISINLPFDLVWNNVLMSMLVFLAAVWIGWTGYRKRICRTVGPSLGVSLESLDHHGKVATFSLFCRYYSDRCSSELVDLAPLSYSRGRSTCYSTRLYYFPVIIPSCYKDVFVNSFFPHIAKLWNSSPVEFFPLGYVNHELTLKVLEFILNSIEKVKPVFSLSSMCVFPELNRTKL